MEAHEVLALIKKQYKPSLKTKSKGVLIDIICTLSMEVSGLRAQLDLLNPKEESKPLEELKTEELKEVSNE